MNRRVQSLKAVAAKPAATAKSSFSKFKFMRGKGEA
jgi:hypothetical protein